MSASSKANAFAKIDRVARNVGWPAWIMDDAALSTHMKELNVTWNDDPFTAVLKVRSKHIHSVRPINCR
jgi:hypothetical protein